MYTCSGKVVHRGEQTARALLTKKRPGRRIRAVPGFKKTVYYCGKCQGFHSGTYFRERRKTKIGKSSPISVLIEEFPCIVSSPNRNRKPTYASI